MKISDSYPTAIAGFFLILAFLALCAWIAGDKYQADLSNDIPDYQEGSGTGHPLWR